jgi:hypothetical protein
VTMRRKARTKEESIQRTIERAKNDFQLAVLVSANRLLIASTIVNNPELRSLSSECLQTLLRLSGGTVSVTRLVKLRDSLLSAESALNETDATPKKRDTSGGH